MNQSMASVGPIGPKHWMHSKHLNNRNQEFYSHWEKENGKEHEYTKVLRRLTAHTFFACQMPTTDHCLLGVHSFLVEKAFHVVCTHRGKWGSHHLSHQLDLISFDHLIIRFEMFEIDPCHGIDHIIASNK